MRWVETGIVVLALAGAASGVVGCKGKGSSGKELPVGAVPVEASARAEGSPITTTHTNAAQPDPQAAPLVQQAPLSFAPIAKKADPGVVTINTMSEEVEPRGIFSRGGRRRETKGLGSGFLIDKDGVVVTNNHVIDGADAISVQLSNGHHYEGKVVGRDPRTDIAVVRIAAKEPLTPLELGDSDSLEVGDWAVAIGNPFGLSHTVSAGIVSAKGRSRDDVPLDPTGYYNFIQTDASINPGNSGGPLFNLKGQVIGMNTAIRGNAQGIGFAIPINMVKQLLPGLLRDGKIIRSALGVRIRDARELMPDERQKLHYDADKGAIIEAVEQGGGADKAGLKAEDVIVGFEGQDVDRGTQLQWLASTAGVGRTVTIRVIRAGKTFDQKVTLGELPEPKKLPKAPPRHAPSNDDDDDPLGRR